MSQTLPPNVEPTPLGSTGLQPLAAEAALELPIADAGPDTIPGSRQPRGFLPLFVAAWFGINLVIGTIGGASIPKVFAFLDDSTKSLNLSIVSVLGGVVVMIITPLFGRMSDRTMSRLGKRRPWILIGTAVGSVGVVMLAFSTSLWPVLAGWCVLQIGYGATNAALHALLADQIPTRTRARVSGLASASSAVALIVGSLLIAALPNSQQWLWFIVPGAVGAVFSVLLFFRLHDIVRTAKAEPWSWREVLSTYWLSPRTYRDFFWAFACRLLVTMSIFSVSLYLLYFIIDRLGIPKEQASGVYATALVIFTVVSIPTTIFFGWLSDRTGRRKAIIWVSCLLSAAGLLVAILSPDLGAFLIAMAIVGAAQGAFVSVDIALMTEVLPTFRDAGKDLGIVSLSYQLPQFFVPLLAIPLLAIGGGSSNYTALYIAAIVFAILGGLSILPIRKVR